MPPLYLSYLNALDVEALALSDTELADAIEAGLAAQGRGETVIEPRVHLVPDNGGLGFNVLRGGARAQRHCSAQSKHDATGPITF
jgi:alanine dehydrogenase